MPNSAGMSFHSRLLHGNWGSELRSPCVYRRHFAHQTSYLPSPEVPVFIMNLSVLFNLKHGPIQVAQDDLKLTFEPYGLPASVS